MGDEPCAEDDEDDGDEVGADAKGGAPNVDPGIGDLTAIAGEDT